MYEIVDEPKERFHMLSIKSCRPQFSLQDAALLARQHYGIEGEVTTLPSERDQNFRLTASDGNDFVLKIAQAGEQRDILDLQNRVMAHLAKRAPSIRTPRL